MKAQFRICIRPDWSQTRRAAENRYLEMLAMRVVCRLEPDTEQHGGGCKAESRNVLMVVGRSVRWVCSFLMFFNL